MLQFQQIYCQPTLRVKKNVVRYRVSDSLASSEHGIESFVNFGKILVLSSPPPPPPTNKRVSCMELFGSKFQILEVVDSPEI